MSTKSSADAISRTVRIFIAKFNIVSPDEAGLKELANIMEDRQLKATTRRFYIAVFKDWSEAVGRPVDVKRVFTRMPPIESTRISMIRRGSCPRNTITNQERQGPVYICYVFLHRDPCRRISPAALWGKPRYDRRRPR